MTNPVLQTALRLVHAGLSVIPIGAHKQPAITFWKGYQTQAPTPEEWTTWCAQGPCGLAIVLGAVSGNAEVIEMWMTPRSCASGMTAWKRRAHLDVTSSEPDHHR
jgi:hypothetical protein